MNKTITENIDINKLENKKDNLCYRFFKRFFDVVISFFALTILSVFLLIIAFIIFCYSGHNPIYKDKRVGKDQKEIGVYKFKTMVEDANDHPEKYLNESQMEQWKKERKVDDDPRETKFGKILRKTSLDELPQFLNVLLGDMSIVGNRPISQFEFDNNFNEQEKIAVSKIRPGITGNWQVYNREQATWESGNRQKYIYDYLAKRSFWLDTKLFILTVPACIKYFFAKASSNK